MNTNPLLIELGKSLDGMVTLRCVRNDGSVTWQKQRGQQAAFFPLHDLTHFAVESVLGTRSGFYGLIASGWDVAETTGKTSKGPLPDEALAVEHLVGMLDAERAADIIADAAELSEHASAFASGNGLTFNLSLTNDALGRIRMLMADLHQRWMALPAGEKLVLRFPGHA